MSKVYVNFNGDESISKYFKDVRKSELLSPEEEVDLAIVDWKGLGQKEHRDEVIAILDKLYIRYKRTSEARKEF